MERSERRFNIIVSLLVVALIMAGAAFFGDYYFDLNDDVLMKDILSGAYTGVPEPNNIQMLYPISAFISLLYRINSGPDWYGIFLCFLQYFCVFVIADRLLSGCRDNLMRIAVAFTVFLFMAGTVGAHFLFVQYTFTVGLMSAAAVICIMTHEVASSGRSLSARNAGFPEQDVSGGKGKGAGDANLILAVVLIGVAYLLRSEMLLLTLPVVGVAILIKWALTVVNGSMDKADSSGGKSAAAGGKGPGILSLLTQKEFQTYLKLCIAIVIVIVASQVVHRIANSPADWKVFNHLFDERTELYDFQYIPDYDENKDFYDSISLAETEQQLLVNYNFGLDDEINADTLGAVASYAASIRTDEIPIPEQLKTAVKLYLYRMRHFAMQKSYQYPMSDFPWNLVLLALYIGVAATFLLRWKKRNGNDKSRRHNDRELLVAGLLLVTLFACRSTLWLYIIVRGRDPIRITHPLYLMEIVTLLGMLFLGLEVRPRGAFGQGRTVNVSQKRESNAGLSHGDSYHFRVVPLLTLVVVAVISAVSIPNQAAVTAAEMESRALMRDHYDALYDYFKDNEDNFYFIDVYTSVSCGEDMFPGETTFSEKMFDRVDNTYANHDLMGGWASKSPLFYRKLRHAGLDNMQDALLLDSVYMVQNKSADTEWLLDYYKEKGIDVTIERVDTVADAFAVYAIKRS